MFNCALSNHTNSINNNSITISSNSTNNTTATKNQTLTIDVVFDDYEDVTGNSSDSVDSVLCDVASSDYDQQHISLPIERNTWQASLFSDDADSMLSDVSKCLVSLSSGLHDDDDVDDNEPISESSTSTLERPLCSSNSVRRYSSLSANGSPYLDRRGLISAEGSIIWDEDGDWIQRYDRMLRLTGKSELPPPGQRSCGCVAKRAAAAAAAASAPLYDEVPQSYKAFVSYSVGSSPRRGIPKIGNRVDITDSVKKAAIRGTSAPPGKRNAIPPSGSSTNCTGNAAGAADEEMFMQAFEDPSQVPRIQIFSAKDLEAELAKISKICSDQSQDWEKRTESLRRLRALVIAGAMNYEEFFVALKNFQDPLLISIKDLRSQVVREACITIAYLSVKIENRCDKLVESLLSDLIGQIQSSAKIMSSSAIVATRFIIQHTHSPRLLKIITTNISSKSKEIRRACCEFLGQLLHTWNVHSLEKNVDILQKAIQKGISDADPDARALSRKAFWAFNAKFKAESDKLLASLDAGKQKMLSDERMSNWSSNSSLNRAPLSMTSGIVRPYSSRQNSVNGSVESLNTKFGTGPRRIPPPTASKPALPYKSPMRTMSNIDLDAQKSIKSKMNTYLGQPRPIMTNSVFSTLSRPQRYPPTSTTDSGSSSQFRTPISSNSRVSKSQPGSRSQSPSRQYYSNIGVAPPLPPALSTVRSAQKSRLISQSRENSREPSPSSIHRTPARSGYERRLSNTSSSRSTASAKRTSNSRILNHSDERSIAKSLLSHVTPRKKYIDDQSDDGSENSSICSDMSFSAYNGRRLESTARIIEKLRSQTWTDRKEGLANLLAVFRESQSCRELDNVQLKELTDIFHRMLIDNQIKSYSLVLNVLNEFIQIYAKQLDYWLYPLMTRLFVKLNNDILGSIQTRILKTLELIRECFPIVDQFNSIMKLISDTRHSLQNKARTIALQHLSKIIFRMDAIDFTYDKFNNHEITTTLKRILYMSSDPKSTELRKICEETIINLYHLNNTQMTLYINSLEPMYQESARQIIDSSHKRKEKLNKAPMTTPYLLKQMKTNIVTSEAIMNRDQFLDSLKKTTHEIQNFSLNYEVNDSYAGAAALMRHIQQEVDNSLSISLDSGISQIDGAGDKIKNGAHNGTPNNVHGRSPQSASSNTRYSIGPAVNLNNTNQSEASGEETLKSFIMDPDAYNDNDLNGLCDIVRGLELDDQICSNLLTTLLNLVSSEHNSARKVILLQTLNSVMVKCPINSPEQQASCIEAFLEAGKDGDKDVMKTLEETTNLAASKFDPKSAFDTLKDYINSDNRSISTGALNLLLKIVDIHKNAVPELLPAMIPYLLKAYDSNESQVRKSTVFCLVAVHGAIGDELYNHLGSLVPNKVKLLRMYVERTSKSNTSS